MAKKICEKCEINQVASRGMTVCDTCLEANLANMAAQNDEQFELRAAELEHSKSVRCFTTDSSVTGAIQKEVGLVFGTSSKQAFWGLSTQADRLTRAYDAALSNLRYEAAIAGANAVVGIRFALNNSTGSGAMLLAGSSDAVMLLGTAVVLK
jgi:uncharacterized protein YbjQ (UPF0145 family)